MTDLHDELTTLARRAPHPDDLTVDLATATWATGRQRRAERRRRRTVALAGATVAATVVAVTGAAGLVRAGVDPGYGPTAAATALSTALSTAPTGTPSAVAPPGAAGPVITPAVPWDSVPDALVTGALTERDGCLLVAGVPVFWPAGTTWDAVARAVVFDGGRRARVGDDFAGGGGYYAADRARLSVLGDDEAAARLLGCAEAVGDSEVVFAAPGTAERPAVSAAMMDRVRAVADRLALWRRPGYGKVVLDFRRPSVTVFWKGPAPVRISEAVGVTRGVRVELVAVDYSERDLTRAGRAILRASRAGGPKVYSVHGNDDYSGVVMEIADTTDLAAVAAWATGLTGLPATAVVGAPIHLQ